VLHQSSCPDRNSPTQWYFVLSRRDPLAGELSGSSGLTAIADSVWVGCASGNDALPGAVPFITQSSNAGSSTVSAAPEMTAGDPSVRQWYWPGTMYSRENL
jgi:hypothetical protein